MQDLKVKIRMSIQYLNVQKNTDLLIESPLVLYVKGKSIPLVSKKKLSVCVFPSNVHCMSMS